MDTIVVAVAAIAAAMTLFSIALASLIPDEYDRGSPRLATAPSRAMRVRQ